MLVVRAGVAFALALAAAACVNARDEDGKTPFDYAKDNEALRGTDAYWRLDEARFKNPKR